MWRLPNKRMQQTKRGGSRPRPASFTESRFAADPRCSTDHCGEPIEIVPEVRMSVRVEEEAC